MLRPVTESRAALTCSENGTLQPAGANGNRRLLFENRFRRFAIALWDADFLKCRHCDIKRHVLVSEHAHLPDNRYNVFAQQPSAAAFAGVREFLVRDARQGGL